MTFLFKTHALMVEEDEFCDIHPIFISYFNRE